jgi:uncharacterized protein (TIGR02996 family)
MSTDRAILTDVIEHPDDDAPRLVFADWLDEHGDPARAEFIRAQCELQHLPDESDRRTALEVLERQLLARHAADWAQPRPAFPATIPTREGDDQESYWSVFRRGFLEGVALHDLGPGHLQPGGEFEQLFAAHPIRELRLKNFLPGGLSALAGRVELTRVEALELTHFSRSHESSDLQRARLADAETLLRSPRLGRLRALELTLFPTESGPPAEWLRLPALSRLQRLRWWPRDGDRAECWNALAADACPELTELHVPWGSYVGNATDLSEAARRFASSPACKRLTRLSIAKADHGEPFPWTEVLSSAPLERLEVSAGSGAQAPALLSALASTPAMNRLRTLRLFGVTATGAGVAGWLERGYAAGVSDLAIQYARLNDDDLERLGKTPALARITRLNLRGYTQCTPRGWQKFFASPHLSGLRHLDVSGAGLTATSVLRLAKSSSLRGLRVLCLGELTKRRPTDPPPAVNLGRGKAFPNLHTLKVWFSKDEKPGELKEMLDSAKLPNLAVLETDIPAGKRSAWKKFASGTRLVWIGGGMSNGEITTGYIALKPEGVYLPNHLDHFG